MVRSELTGEPSKAIESKQFTDTWSHVLKQQSRVCSNTTECQVNGRGIRSILMMRNTLHLIQHTAISFVTFSGGSHFCRVFSAFSFSLGSHLPACPNI